MGLLPAWGEKFEVGKVIHPVVAELPAPQLSEGFGKGQMAITTRSDEAARHFALGVTKLNTMWDFEAYRHFCEAVKLDPECLMGYWGISMSLAGVNHEFFEERKAAIDRMLDLLEAEKEAGTDRWNVMETGFVQATGYLLTDGPRVAGQTFEALARKYPANLQARLLALVMKRDGFDRRGKPRLGQRRAERGLEEMLEAHPENLSIMTSWINLRCQSPGGAAELRDEVLPVARKLAERKPDYPPFQLILAQVELRCGNFVEGLKAATQAKELFEGYMEKEGVTVYDCGGWVKSQLFRAELFRLRGERAKALEIARELSARKVEEERVFSQGAVLLMWEGRTLGARLMIAGSKPADFIEGQDIMKLQGDEAWFKEKSFALYYRDCLAFYLAVRGAIADGKVPVAKEFYDQFLLRVQGFEKTRPLASKTSSYSQWIRAASTVAMLLPELRGVFAETEEGATRMTAATWYRSARDRQLSPSTGLPPTVPYPMEWRLGNHYAGGENYVEAASWYLKALDMRPNHPAILGGLEKVADKLGKTEEAAALRKQIEKVTE